MRRVFGSSAARADGHRRKCPHGLYPGNGAGGPGTAGIEVKGMSCQRAYAAIKRCGITETEPAGLRTRGFACTARSSGVASLIVCVQGSEKFKFTLGT
jgi:hypothetical protein